MSPATGAAGSKTSSVPPPRAVRRPHRQASDESGTPDRGQPQRRKPVEPGSPVTDLPGINKGLAGKLAKLGVETVADAATLFPRRFNDFTDVRKIADLQPLPSAQTVVGTLYTVKQRRFGRRLAGSEAVLVDSSGSLKAVWFNQPYVAKALNTGDEVVLSGKVREYRGRLQMDNPEYEPYDRELMAPGRLVPVYPATQGLGQRTLRKVVRTALEAVGDRIPDPIPRECPQRVPPARAPPGRRALPPARDLRGGREGSPAPGPGRVRPYPGRRPPAPRPLATG
ncbi:MAG: hypothetical protein U5Q44_02235 [Dehalococcoidia bacterium]|nr:hypothetical protein [Dehalococcoidia bacterium]